MVPMELMYKSSIAGFIQSLRVHKIRLASIVFKQYHKGYSLLEICILTYLAKRLLHISDVVDFSNAFNLSGRKNNSIRVFTIRK